MAITKRVPKKKSAAKPTSRKTSKASRRVKPSPSLLSLFPEYRRKAYLANVAAQQEDYISELAEAYRHKGLVLYLGAGVSRSVGLPNWSELVRSLTVAMMTRKVKTAIETFKDVPSEKYWEVLREIQKDVEQETDPGKPILVMARALKDELGNDLADVLGRTLYRPVWRYLRAKRFHAEFRGKKRELRPAGQLPSSSLLDAIVALTRAERDVRGVQAIVNYNFDDLVDEKLREQNVRCKTLRSGRDRVPPGVLPCYHVHGVLPLSAFSHFRPSLGANAVGNFVFSEDEYHEEYSDAYRWSNMTQMSFLGRHTGLFVGLSMEDPNIRRLVDVTHRQYPEVPNYAILTRKRALKNARDNKKTVLRNLFEEVEGSSFGKIGVRAIWADNFSDVPKIIRGVCET